MLLLWKCKPEKAYGARSLKFWKLTFWWLLLVVLMTTTPPESNSASGEGVRRWTFKPPLKGREILLEAKQYIGSEERSGIWALDPETGEMRFLIPHGKHPIWGPRHNHFAYREGPFIRVVHKSGAYDVRLSNWLKGAELAGWGPNERWLLFVAPSSALFYPQKESRLGAGPRPEGKGSQFFQGIFVAFFDPPNNYSEALAHPFEFLKTVGEPLDTFKAFPFHHCGNPSVSPDGRHIIFEVFRYASGVGKLSSKIAIAEIKQVEKEGYAKLENVRRLTQLPEELMEVNPHWSPDGKMIAFDVIDPKDGTRTPHVIGADGTGLKGLKLTKEEIGIFNYIRLQDGLTKTEHEDELRVLGWLADGRLVLVEAKPAAISCSPDQIADRVWVVDLQHRHPPLSIIPTASPGGIKYGLLAISSTERRIAWVYGAGDMEYFGGDIINIPPPEDKEAIRIAGPQQGVAELKLSNYLGLIPLLPNFEVYWISW